MPSKMHSNGRSRRSAATNRTWRPNRGCKYSHALRNIFCEMSSDNHAPAWQRLEQLGSQSAGAAAGIEQQLVTVQPESGKNFLAPTDLRLRKTMVFGGIPLARWR